MNRARRGSVLLEATMASVVLAVAFIAVAQLLATAVKQRRETQWRTLATRAAANALEHVVARPWDELATDKLAEVGLPEDVASRLPEGRLSVEVSSLDEPVPTRQIRVSVDWRNAAGVRTEPIVLMAWRSAAAAAPEEAP